MFTSIVLKQIGLVLLMQGLSLLLEYLDTKTLTPTVKKRLAIECCVLVVYSSGMTVFKGMISEELLTLIGTAYTALVVGKLYLFVSSKNKYKSNDELE